MTTFSQADYLVLMEFDRLMQSGSTASPDEAVRRAIDNLREALDTYQPCPDGVPEEWYRTQMADYHRRQVKAYAEAFFAPLLDREPPADD